MGKTIIYEVILMLLTAKEKEFSNFGKAVRWLGLVAVLWIAACFGWSLIR